jgi:hypothetical protein
VEVPASTQWQVAREAARAIKPAYEELVRCAAAGDVLHNDDTYVRILELMGKRRAELVASGLLPNPERTGLFTTAIVSKTEFGAISFFFSGRKHAGENLDKVLERREPNLAPPILMCDALDRNIPAGHRVLESNCVAHGRRHIVDEATNFPEKCAHVLTELAKVFKNEKICRKRGLAGEERLRFHQNESASVMDALEKWMKAELDEKRVEPNSGLGTAFNYLLKRWDKLTLFLRVPDAPIEKQHLRESDEKGDYAQK